MRRRLLIVAIVVVVLIAGGYVGRKYINSPRHQAFGELVSRVNTSEKVVALTFDDGPTPADTEAVLNALTKADVRATFYINGEPASKDPDSVKRLVAAGHELGNHTWSHRRMVLVTPSTVASEIERTDEQIRAAGVTGTTTFRPPFGKKFLALPKYLADHGRATVTWDVAVETFTDTPQSPSEIIDQTVANVSPGSIILLHPWNDRTQVQQSIEPVVSRLKADGYRFVTVSELLAMR